MKSFTKMLILYFLFHTNILLAEEPRINGNNNNVNICQPQVVSDSCCKKPKVVYRIKVVEKRVEVPVEKVVVTEKIVQVDRPVLVTQRVVLKQKPRKNRISLLGGVGPTELELTDSKAALKREAVGGIQYQYLFTERISGGLQLQTNETVLGSIGWEF